MFKNYNNRMSTQPVGNPSLDQFSNAQRWLGDTSNQIQSSVNPYIQDYTGVYQGFGDDASIDPISGEPMSPDVTYQGFGPGTELAGQNSISRSNFENLDPSQRMAGSGNIYDDYAFTPEEQQAMEENWMAVTGGGVPTFSGGPF